MSTLAVNTLQAQTGTAVSVASGHRLSLPGHVINVESVNFAGTQSTTSQTFIDITNLSISMTPTTANSKFFVSCSIAVANSQHFTYMRFVRNGTVLLVNDDIGNRQTGHFNYATTNNGSSNYVMLHVPSQVLDSPSTTSTVTYKVQMAIRTDGSGTAYINRTTRDLNNSGGYDGRGVSTLTVMEIAG
ncbi:MAG: hypothetical protein CMB98_06880 [Flavobacteriaceae bacterium]|nr:hypothetical protein [Flavobacteriaceae bacterium]|tara:strand:+ start:468 stop:1028 length:561 start_codon:yes stop_codon:yes gene_type:complete